jgi:hypothetical protein
VCGKAKINQFDCLTFFVYYDVVKLDVAMTDAPPVEVRDCVEELGYYERYLVF